MTSENLRKNKKFKGLAINSGRSLGQACLYSAERHKAVPEYSLATPAAVAHELERFSVILEHCSNELNRIATQVTETIGKAEAEIFLTQKHIMNDPRVLDSIRERVEKERKNIEWAISEVLNEFEDRFAKLDNQYLRERASDIGEIRRRLLSSLGNSKNGFICEGHQHCARGENRVIVSEELTPEMIMSMNVEKVLGFVTEHGGITSHAAIIARSLGIPAVSGVLGIMDYIRCGDRVLVDGDTGEVYIAPDESVISTLMPVENVLSGEICIINTPPGMEVLANASTIDDVKVARGLGADGVGLFRTEIAFIRAGKLLTEEEQVAFYSSVLNELPGKPVVFRLLDAGGDKPLPFMRVRKEANPYLGWRGARFLLGNMTIFETQMRALARVSSKGKIKILFPMIIDVVQVKELFTNARRIIAEETGNAGSVDLGVMFEVPSAFLQAREIYEHADFGSIGSNDLIQYLFAIDRGNELVSGDYDPEHPVLWKLLESLSTIAKEFNKPLSICGEIAGRETMVNRLIDIGIKSLSVSPRLIPRVRNEMARRLVTLQESGQGK